MGTFGGGGGGGEGAFYSFKLDRDSLTDRLHPTRAFLRRELHLFIFRSTIIRNLHILSWFRGRLECHSPTTQ